MKKIFFYLSITVLLTNCRKEEKFNTVFDSFALKNGSEWKATSYSQMYKKDTIDIDFSVHNEYGEERGAIDISNLSLRYGKQIINNDSNFTCKKTFASYYTLEADGDVIGDTYDVCENEYNYIELTRIDTEKKYIEGIFQITLAKEPYFHDTLRFTKGCFISKYIIKTN